MQRQQFEKRLSQTHLLMLKSLPGMQEATGTLLRESTAGGSHLGSFSTEITMALARSTFKSSCMSPISTRGFLIQQWDSNSSYPPARPCSQPYRMSCFKLACLKHPHVKCSNQGTSEAFPFSTINISPSLPAFEVLPKLQVMGK